MKTLGRTLALGAAVLVLGLAALTGAVAAGWLPLPGLVIQAAAAARGLDPAQARTLDRAAQVYHTLKTSPEAPWVDRALALAGRTQAPRAWEALAIEAWPQVSAATKERLRTDLGAAPDRWAQVTAAVDAVVARASQGGGLSPTPAEAEVLNRFAAETGFLDLLKGVSK